MTRRRRPAPRLPLPQRVETGPDGYEYEVRPVAAARAVKTYRCPGCDHEIRSGTAHVVVLPIGTADAVADRRHWHTPCWANRGNRGPTRKWS
ncbi:hypothetical protein A5634_24070 [Mycobacterium asiaticum]|uniref:ATP/GTP-binding protein n=1 Tax=Mycobacterium asiaticum TaxID=1790 RepID=A0A1A3P0U8_MYCAS|nr:hypothetical protein [Mycobacterium asiaticum]OBK26889.1 hypothetical protein A5634_24070 [Mycobacterium asiaticum]